MTLFLLAALSATVADYPSVTLKNAQLELTVYMPDAKAGFYRGTRFDHAGVMAVKFGDRDVFGPWKAGHNPESHDDIVGPVDEFGSEEPLGYAAAKAGETFLKIGVGELIKAKDEKYEFWKKVEVKAWGQWTTSRPQDGIGFEQALLLKNGYGYRYQKTVTLLPNGFVLKRTLTNSGTKPFTTDSYNHNFFTPGTPPVGPNTSLTFAFEPAAKNPKDRFAEAVALKDRRMSFTQTLEKGSIHAELTGHGGTAADNKFWYYDAAQGVQVAVACDAPLHKFNVWGIGRTLCPEPFVRFTLEPGESKSWSTTYTLVFAK